MFDPNCCHQEHSRALVALTAQQIRKAAITGHASVLSLTQLQTLAPSLSYSVIVPCFNCAESIKHTLATIEASMLYHQHIARNYGWNADSEIVIVNDASSDNSSEVISDWLTVSTSGIRYVIVTLSENAGRSMAREVRTLYHIITYICQCVSMLT